MPQGVALGALTHARIAAVTHCPYGCPGMMTNSRAHCGARCRQPLTVHDGLLCTLLARLLLRGYTPHTHTHTQVIDAINALSRGKKDNTATAADGAVISDAGQIRKGKHAPKLDQM